MEKQRPAKVHHRERIHVPPSKMASGARREAPPLMNRPFALINYYAWNVQAIVPEAYDHPSVALHAVNYHSIGMPESGRCAGIPTRLLTSYGDHPRAALFALRPSCNARSCPSGFWGCGENMTRANGHATILALIYDTYNLLFLFVKNRVPQFLNFDATQGV